MRKPFRGSLQIRGGGGKAASYQAGSLRTIEMRRQKKIYHLLIATLISRSVSLQSQKAGSRFFVEKGCEDATTL